MTAALGLGTVQFGLDYGIANVSGRPSPDTVAAILAEAAEAGLRVLDTAALYGGAEEALGAQDLSPFQVVTKTARFFGGQVDAAEAAAIFQRSLHRLRLPQVYGLMAHNAEDLLCPGGEALYGVMRAFKDQGMAGRIGSSVYNGAEIDALLERYELDVVQIPINVLDQRLVSGGQLRRLKDRGVEVHARSAFLQGLLLMEPASVPAYFDPIRPMLARWRDAAREQGLSPVQAALAWVRHLPGIDVVVVGVADLAQFRQCRADFAQPLAFDAGGLACDDPAFVDPQLWRV